MWIALLGFGPAVPAEDRVGCQRSDMLTALAFAMVATFMALLLTKRASPIVALTLVPVFFGILAGHGRGLGPMMVDGITTLAPTAAMLAFAILYFGIMGDAGLFAPLVRVVVRAARGKPRRVVVGSAVLALVVSLDGDGATTYILCVGALLPLYRALQLDPRVLGCLLMLACGITNTLPWGGPTVRAASALGVDVNLVLGPLLPAIGAGALGVLGIAYVLGTREQRRLGARATAPPEPLESPPSQHLAINAVLTVGLLASLVAGVLPLAPLFMLACAVALIVNARTAEAQKALYAKHAPNIFAVISVIFAAGVFTGIFSGTGMVQALAELIVRLVPDALGPRLALVTGVLSMPLAFFLSNDAFLFGVLPILAKAGAAYGIPPVELARASILTQSVHLLSPLVPSTYLLVGLLDVELGQHQKKTLPWAIGLSMAVLGAAVVLGALPLR